MRSKRSLQQISYKSMFTIREGKNKSREAVMLRNENDINYRSDVFKRN